MVQKSYWKSAPRAFVLSLRLQRTPSPAVEPLAPCHKLCTRAIRSLFRFFPEQNSKGRATARSSPARVAAMTRIGIPCCRDWPWSQLPLTSRTTYLEGSVVISLQIIHGSFPAPHINSFPLLWHFNPMCNFLSFWVLLKTDELTCFSTQSVYIFYSQFPLPISSPYS